MQCREAQKAENLDYGSTASLDFCKVSDNTNIIVSVNDSQMTNHEDHTEFSKGESKWEKFLEINSYDDIGKFRFLNFVIKIKTQSILNFVLTSDLIPLPSLNPKIPSMPGLQGHVSYCFFSQSVLHVDETLTSKFRVFKKYH